MEVGLVQTMDATVADKGERCGESCQSARLAKKRGGLDSDQMRVCECRNFLKTNGVKVWDDKLFEILKEKKGDLLAKIAADGAPQASLLQRNFDTALAAKKKKATASTSTTTTTTVGVIDMEKWSFNAQVDCTECVQFPGWQTLSANNKLDLHRLPDGRPSDPRFATVGHQCCTLQTKAITEGCTAAKLLDSWTTVAKMLNDPDIVALYGLANITEGWQHCDKSWVVHGACHGFVDSKKVLAATDPETFKLLHPVDPAGKSLSGTFTDPVRWAQESKPDRERLVAQELDEARHKTENGEEWNWPSSTRESSPEWNQHHKPIGDAMCGIEGGKPRLDCTSAR